MTGGGIVMLLLFQIYSLLPLAGALAVIAGLVGFFTGAHFALRAFLAGLAMLAVKPIVGAIFLKAIERHSRQPLYSDETLSQNTRSKIPVEITKEDIEAYEREQLKELESYKNDPAYNFDD